MEASFPDILRAHAVRYPLMEPQDYGKLAFQGEFGPEHMIEDEQWARTYLIREWEEVSGAEKQGMSAGGSDIPEDIGGGLCRFPLSACSSRKAAELLADLFLMTAKELTQGNVCSVVQAVLDARRIGHGRNQDRLADKLELLAQLKVPGMREWLADWKKKDCPPVHHSRAYSAAYHPHYRLLRKEYAGYFPALLEICGIMDKITEKRGTAVIAIDGRCASGKTHFAGLISRLLPCNILHMDDFYLPLDGRLENWTEIPGGNMDFDRFRSEILNPVKAREACFYRPYNCQKGEMGEARRLPCQPLTVVEGSYSHHPSLVEYYDLKIFLTCSRQVQTARLHVREGGHFSAYEERWVPMEEHYFQHYGIEQGSDLTVDTSLFFG